VLTGFQFVGTVAGTAIAIAARAAELARRVVSFMAVFPYKSG
jgi:hypothetical protein